MLNDVIKLNAAILSGQMTTQAGINSLVSIYGIDETEARTLIN
jgi:hypothetical protein